VALQHLAQAAEVGAAPASCVRQVITAGEALQTTPQVARWFGPQSGRTLHNQYGPTESHVVTAFDLRGPSATWPARPPIGRPIANAQMYILDCWLDPAPAGVPGELYIGGTGVARGYLGRPELTAERFVPDPFGRSPGARLYRTGDLCRWAPEGQIEFLGRIDQQVKIRGFRVEPGEIESVLEQLEGVKDRVVAVRPDAAGNARLVAYVVAEAGATLEPRRILAALEERLPEFMVPSAVVVLDALPLSPNGKVDRRRLPAPESSRPELAAPFVEPRTEQEIRLSRLWSEVLGVDRVGVHDDFFELGGHSLLAMQLVSRIRRDFRLDVPLREVFEARTVAALAQALQRAGHSAGEPIRPIDREGPLSLSFAQERLWFLDQLVPNSPFYNVPAAVRVEGALDVAALQRSLNEIVRRHASLRTTFHTVAGRPRQEIAPSLTLELPLIDLTGVAVEERDEHVRRLAREEAQRPFDLSRGPLLRVTLLRLGESEHVALLTMHHIVSDGWSIGVLVRELSALYDAFASGRPSPLGEPELQYVDYAHWQRQWLQGEVLERELAYWRERLAELGVLDLPTDRPRPAVQLFRGAARSFELAPDLVRGVRRLGEAEGATVYMTLLAAFKALLGRYSRRTTSWSARTWPTEDAPSSRG
jgi:acyl carrier protein